MKALVFKKKIRLQVLRRIFVIVTCFVSPLASTAQSILPPAMEWHGESEKLIAKSNDPWITPAEQASFVTTPNYNETINWLKKLTSASPILSMISIGKSVEGRDIVMIIASTEKNVSAAALKASTKPLLLAQAGIHAGEIDGKDAGMMLLRDVAYGKKKILLEKANFLFIPILNVDGHERSSPYNRPNQRGPENMGWRTNAQNLNLNRDYTKLDTKEIRSVIKVINEYDPALYMDVHVTDGADYQYDITFGGISEEGYSPAIRHWLINNFKTAADADLRSKGHIPGPLMFAVNDRDFSQGNIMLVGGPRFSDSYGDIRHLPTILVENHSLKPYKQRVLGTYVLLESALNILAKHGGKLKEATMRDKSNRLKDLPMAWKVPQMNKIASVDAKSTEISGQATAKPDSLDLLGIAYEIRKSTVTDGEYAEWLGKPVSVTIPYYKPTQPAELVSRPKRYWIPAGNDEVIARLKLHGIKMETIAEPREVAVEMYKLKEYFFGNENHQVQPFEGHMQVQASVEAEKRKQLFPKGSVFISTDQPLGDLAMLLLEPASNDSYFSWGFFPTIFQRTEYIEAYVMEPMAKRMLDESPELKKEFEEKKKNDSAFAKNQNAILGWFYGKTKYFDNRYLLYPVGREF